MGFAVHSSDLVGAKHPSARGHIGQAQVMECTTMSDVLRKCSDLIASTIGGRIHELGGTDRDAQQIAETAALAVFTWSAGELIGG